jgi:hypothetical protein
MIKFSTLTIFCLLLLSGCTIEKRQYSSGYHTTWNIQKILPKKSTANKFENEKYLRSDTRKRLNKDSIAVMDENVNSLEGSKEFLPIQIKKQEKKNRKKQLKETSDTVPYKYFSPEEKNYLTFGRKLRVAKTVCITSTIALILSGLLLDSSLPLVSTFLAPVAVGALVFGFLAVFYFNRKKQALDDFQRSTNLTSTPQERTKAINNLKLQDLKGSIKLTNRVIIISGIAIVVSLIIDTLGIGALEIVLSPIPIIVFAFSLLAIIGLQIKKRILIRRAKK